MTPSVVSPHTPGPISPFGATPSSLLSGGMPSPTLLRPVRRTYADPYAARGGPPRYGPGTSQYFPMATPFTNPGLCAMPPPPSSRMPVSPPPDYRPPSPSNQTFGGAIGASYSYANQGLGGERSEEDASYPGSGSPTTDLRKYAAPPFVGSLSLRPHSPPPPEEEEESS